MNKLKVGDWIKCHDENDCRNILNNLSKLGYGAVIMSVSYRHIVITSVPEDHETH